MKDYINVNGILKAVLVVAVFAMSFGFTHSYLSDTETSAGNTFTAYVWNNWTQTTQSDFQNGTGYNIDTVSSPENVTLALAHNCTYRMKLTFNNSASSEDLIDFPVMVKLNSSRIDYSKTNETDIRFYDADDSTSLSHHVEKWDESGDSFVWVKVPQINSISSDDYIWAYYGCSGAADSDGAGTYNSNFVMVQHLNETSGTTHYDSTSNDNDGTYYGANQDASGQIDGADEFDGSNDYVNTGNSSTLDLTTFTIDVWVKVNLNKNYNAIVIKGFDAFENYELIGKSDGAIYFTIKWSDGSRSYPLFPVGSLVKNEWVHIAATYNGTHMKGYKNGTEVLSLSISKTPQINNRPVLIGAEESNTGLMPPRFFNGTIDEVRISNTARSASWIKASYLAMADSFITYGAEELYPSSGTLESSSFDAGSNVTWKQIYWTADVPAGTSLEFQFASNNDNSTWDFTGPDGTSSTYYATSGTDIWHGHNNTRYIKYKAFLNTTDPAKTPVLSEVRIYYSS